MGLADEHGTLQELHSNGSLSDEEFAQAKAALLKNPSLGTRDNGSPSRSGYSLADMIWMWFKFRFVMAIIGLVVFAIFFFAFWLPGFRGMQSAIPLAPTINIPHP